ncbi:MAG: septum formation initiator family protein [Romboutsia sp.]
MNIRKKFSGQFVVVGIFLIFTCVSLATGFVFQVTKLKQYKNEIAGLETQISESKLEIKMIKKLGDSQDLETIARTRLNMIKQDETIYIDTEGR